jgi:putative peptidoglycan lipid II flippase
MKNKFTSTIAGASIFIALISLFVKGLGFLREIIFAGYFGTGKDFDLYLVGAVLPVTIDTVLLYVGQNYFIPAYNDYTAQGGIKRKEFLFKTFVRFFLGGILLAAILLIAANPILEFYAGDDSISNYETIHSVFLIFLCTIPLSAGTSILSAYLQSELEFRFPSIARLFLNISVITFVLIFAERIGVFVIALGYLTGGILQLLYLIIKSGIRIPSNLFKTLLEKDTPSSALTYSIVTIVLIEAISQLYLLFDRYFYNDVTTGGIAALNYAFALFVFPIGIFSMALATAIFPKITSTIKDKNNMQIKSIFLDSLQVILFLFTPISFIFIFFSDEVVRLIFERGSFSEMSTQYTATSLAYYSISLVFYAAYGVINKIFYSSNLTKSLLMITVTGSLLKLLLNLILVKSLQHNGLALATTITYLYFFVLSFIVLNIKLRIGTTFEFATNLVIVLANALISYLVTYIIVQSFYFNETTLNVFQILLFVLLFVWNLHMIKHPSIRIFTGIYLRVKEKTFQNTN